MQHACESVGVRPVGAMRVKADAWSAEAGAVPNGRPTVDRSRATLWWDSSESVPVATRKMVNYA